MRASPGRRRVERELRDETKTKKRNVLKRKVDGLKEAERRLKNKISMEARLYLYIYLNRLQYTKKNTLGAHDHHFAEHATLVFHIF
jgi:hypothetical protein